MYCKKCGAKVSEGKFFCTNCGNPVRDKGEPVVESRAKNERQPAERKSQAINVKQPPERKKQRRGKKPWIIGISSGVLVLAVVVVALFATGVLGGGDKTEDSLDETMKLTKEKTSVKTESSAVSAEEMLEDAYEAYKEYADENGYLYDEDLDHYSFALVYLDNDNVPELLIGDNSSTVEHYTLCIYSDGKVIELSDFTSSQHTYFKECSGYLYDADHSHLMQRDIVYKFTGSSIKEVFYEEYEESEKEISIDNIEQVAELDLSQYGEWISVLEYQSQTLDEAFIQCLKEIATPSRGGKHTEEEIKEALEAYQQEIGDAQCCLIYVNDDDIPECVYSDDYGQHMLAYINGEVVEENSEYIYYYPSIFYQEKTGKFLFDSEKTTIYYGSYNSEIFQLESAGFNLIGSASKVYSRTFNDNLDLLSEDWNYNIGESEENVGEARYNEYISSFGQFQEVECIFDTVKEAYQALHNPDSVPENSNSNESSKSSDSSDIVTAQVSDEEQPEAVEINVEEEVKKIRELYNTTQNNLDSLLPAGYADNIHCYFDGAYPAKVTIPSGYKGWNYNREYYYNNKELYFAFVYKGSEEHRLYFKDGILIRYIDENKNIYDYGNEELASFSEWKNKVQSESEELYPTMINCGA